MKREDKSFKFFLKREREGHQKRIQNLMVGSFSLPSFNESFSHNFCTFILRQQMNELFFSSNFSSAFTPMKLNPLGRKERSSFLKRGPGCVTGH